MKLRKAWLLVLLLALTQLLAAANAEDAHEDASDTENAIEEEEEEEEEEDDLEVKEENGVLVLNDANFDNFVADRDTVLLEFYAPWCGHCKQFAPEYEKIASTLRDNDPPIAVAKIDATSASMLASRFDVNGYPTIKILKKGQAVDYEGSRTQEEIVARVREVSQPDWTPPPEVTLSLTKDNFDDVVNNADIILVEFYAPWYVGGQVPDSEIMSVQHPSKPQPAQVNTEAAVWKCDDCREIMDLHTEGRKFSF